MNITADNFCETNAVSVDKVKVSLVVPTYNGGDRWILSTKAIISQNIDKADIDVCVIDSGSDDGSYEHSVACGFHVIKINSFDFNHGGTRNFAIQSCSKSDIVVLLTQDAILNTPDALEHMLKCFSDPSIGAVCGRQLPHFDANPLAVHARFFNYPEESKIKSIQDIPALGLKVAFMSNSFSAYRREVYDELGGFPSNTILAEDMYLTAKIILAGYKVAYCGESAVRHSHNYTPWEEFRRYFDIGVFHACESWIQRDFGGASGEGVRFIKSEVLYLFKHAPHWVPRCIITVFCKLLGYKLGQVYKKLPKFVRPILSMYKGYWSHCDNNK